MNREQNTLLRRASRDVGALLAALALALGCGGEAHSGGSGSGGQSAASGSGGSAVSLGGNPDGGALVGVGGRTQGGAIGAGGSPAHGGSSGGDAAGGAATAQGGNVNGAGGFLGLAGSISVAGAAGEGGAAASPTCDVTELWRAIVVGAVGGLGTCDLSSVPSAEEKLGHTRGAVVIDANGRVIDNTGLMGAEKQEWLDMLSGKLWTCYAGQTLGYKCKAAA